MTIGYIGLGKMGFNMVERLLEKGYEVVASNRSIEKVREIEKQGAIGAESSADVVSKLNGSRLIWIMVPWKAIDGVLEEILPHLEEGDTIIDGGNSPYKESIRRGRELSKKGIHFLDVGTSGGPGGARNGACMMIGGSKEKYDEYKQLFVDLCVPEGEGYMGEHGAGHFVKMVHNGIEYGMMQAIGEGFEVMKKASEFDIDLKSVVNVYNHGSVIESRLIGWLQSGFKKYGVDLKGISGEVSHSGEGQWTVDTAKEQGTLVPIIEGSLQFRKDSQGNPSYTGQVVSVQRNQFGGHDVAEKS